MVGFLTHAKSHPKWLAFRPMRKTSQNGLRFDQCEEPAKTVGYAFLFHVKNTKNGRLRLFTPCAEPSNMKNPQNGWHFDPCEEVTKTVGYAFLFQVKKPPTLIFLTHVKNHQKWLAF